VGRDQTRQVRPLLYFEKSREVLEEVGEGKKMEGKRKGKEGHKK
jgi:hypothetical protein